MCVALHQTAHSDTLQTQKLHMAPFLHIISMSQAWLKKQAKALHAACLACWQSVPGHLATLEQNGILTRNHMKQTLCSSVVEHIGIY